MTEHADGNKVVTITAEQAGTHEVRALHDHIMGRGPCRMNDILAAVSEGLRYGHDITVIVGPLQPVHPDTLLVVMTELEEAFDPSEDDPDYDGPVWSAGDLVVACPHKGCGNLNEFIERDQSHVRENEVHVDESWIEVVANDDGRDMHTIDWLCAECRNPVEWPDDYRYSPTWG